MVVLQAITAFGGFGSLIAFGGATDPLEGSVTSLAT
jgi:hypothetical protein